MIFMDRVSRRGFWVASLFFADDVLVLASPSCDLEWVQGQFNNRTSLLYQNFTEVMNLTEVFT